MSDLHPDLKVACDAFRDHARLGWWITDAVIVDAVRSLAGIPEPPKRGLCFYSDRLNLICLDSDEAPVKHTLCGRRGAKPYRYSFGAWEVPPKPCRSIANAARVTCEACLEAIAKGTR